MSSPPAPPCWPASITTGRRPCNTPLSLAPRLPWPRPPDLDLLLAGPRVFALFPAGRHSKPRRPLSPSTPVRPPWPLLLSLPSHTTAAITPRAASKLVARVVPLPTRSGLALLAAAPPGHLDPVPPGVSPRALVPVLLPATACCCSCGCAAPASRVHHRAIAPASPACSPRRAGLAHAGLATCQGAVLEPPRTPSRSPTPTSVTPEPSPADTSSYPKARRYSRRPGEPPHIVAASAPVLARKHHHRPPPLQHAPVASAAAPLAAPGRRLPARARPSRLLAGEGRIPEALSRIRPPSPCCPSPDLDRLLAGPRVFALFPVGRQQASAPPLPINAGEAPRALLLSLPSHTTAAITPRAASKLVARIVPLPTRSGLALLAAAPPGHRDPVPPGVSPRALAPVLWPATACCCSCGCAAPASRVHHRATAPASPTCSPRRAGLAHAGLKNVRRTISRDLAGRTSTSQVPDPALKARADTGVTLDCPSAEESDDVSITNSEVESAMNHRRRRAALRDPGFTKEAFNAFSSADAEGRNRQIYVCRYSDWPS
nr:proline-rich protein 36-like [Aegilops tauschii subsp. strangulata]